MGMLTPAWREDEAARRQRSTQDVLDRADEARSRASRSERAAENLLRDYRAGDNRLGRMSGR